MIKKQLIVLFSLMLKQGHHFEMIDLTEVY